MWFKVKKSIVSFLLHLFGSLPLRVHYFNARWIAVLLEKVVKYRVDLVDENLSFAFPEKSPEERLQIRHEFYRHFARIFLEAMWFGTCHDGRKLRRAGIVTALNPEDLVRLYESAPSVMILSAHTGNWELIGGMNSYSPKSEEMFDEDTWVVVYRKLNNKIFDSIMLENRTAPLHNRNFEGALESKKVLRYMLQHRNDKRVYDFIADQRPYFSQYDTPKIEFMNRRCSVMSASSEIACKFGMAVVYLRMKELHEGKYTMEFVTICEDASKMDYMDIIKQYYKLLEDDLRDQPYNYLWTHNRWAW